MATISDIAKQAGVSIATVSHVVNGTRYVSPELKKRVEDAIKAADSTPNFVKRKIRLDEERRRHAPRYVLMITASLSNPYNLALVNRLSVQLEGAGLRLVFFDISDKSVLPVIRSFFRDDNRPRGLITAVDVCDPETAEFIKSIHVPTVVIGNRIDGVESDRVYTANEQGAYTAALHLIRSGHINIAMICGDNRSESNRERIDGYRRSLKENAVPFREEFICQDVDSEEKLYAAMDRLLSGYVRPTAVFIANYKNALSIFRYISERSIECPKELSIICFNDNEWFELTTPPVTTVAQDMEKLCAETAALLCRRIESADIAPAPEPDEAFRSVSIASKLIVRGTTAGIGRGPFGEKAADISELILTKDETSKVREGKYTAVISLHYSGKSWMRLLEDGIRTVFDDMNISILSISDAHFDPELQNRQLRSLMQLEPDILISIPTDNGKTADTYREIIDNAGKTKFVFISNIPHGIEQYEYVTCVSVNERTHGRNAGRGLGEYLSQAGRRNAALICHKADFSTTNQRDLAAEQLLSEEYANLTICGKEYFEKEEDAYAATTRLLQQHPEVDGIYVSWEGPAQYVLKALSDAGRQDVVITTADLELSDAINMASGGSIKAISAQRVFEQGQAIALAAAGTLINRHVPGYIGVEPVYVEKSNLLKAWKTIHRQDPPEELSSLF